MSAKLSVIFYIILCLEIGIVLTLLPWIPQGTLGLSDWGNNYFLLFYYLVHCLDLHKRNPF